ncbi:MAG: ATP-binding cassette domain-containing protein [bacterium]
MNPPPDTLEQVMGDGGTGWEGRCVLRAEGVVLSPEGGEGSEPLDLEIEAGERVAVVLDSEWEARALPRALLGLEPPVGGRVELLGEDIYDLPERQLLELRRHIGVVLHNGGLIHNLTVWYNVALPALYHSRFQDTEGVERRVDLLLRRCRVRELRDLRPALLDEYTRKRVALARSWVLSPDLVVLEDPLVDVDTGSGARILDMVLGEAPGDWEGEDPRPHQAGVLITSQGFHEAFFRQADRMVVVHRGSTIFDGPPSGFDRRGKKHPTDILKERDRPQS